MSGALKASLTTTRNESAALMKITVDCSWTASLSTHTEKRRRRRRRRKKRRRRRRRKREEEEEE